MYMCIHVCLLHTVRRNSPGTWVIVIDPYGSTLPFSCSIDCCDRKMVEDINPQFTNEKFVIRHWRRDSECIVGGSQFLLQTQTGHGMTDHND